MNHQEYQDRVNDCFCLNIDSPKEEKKSKEEKIYIRETEENIEHYFCPIEKWQEFETKNLFICLNILITNLLVSSFGSYGGITYSNIISWFFGAYEEYNAKELSSIGFFFYANPISALLIVIFPVKYPLLNNLLWIETSIFTTIGVPLLISVNVITSFTKIGFL